MYRRFALLTVFTLLLASLAVPASAKQPADIAALVDAALAARLHAADQAQDALDAAPGQSSTKIEARQARLAEKPQRIKDKWGSLEDHPGRAIGLHALFAGCNPGQGKRVGFDHSWHHGFVACTTVTTALAPYSGPPGHDPSKVKTPDDADDADS